MNDTNNKKQDSSEKGKKFFKDNNPYEMLEVQQNASKKEIESAFRRKSFGVHPDKSSIHGLTKEEAERQFNNLSNARDYLLKQCKDVDDLLHDKKEKAQPPKPESSNPNAGPQSKPQPTPQPQPQDGALVPVDDNKDQNNTSVNSETKEADADQDKMERAKVGNKKPVEDLYKHNNAQKNKEEDIFKKLGEVVGRAVSGSGAEIINQVHKRGITPYFDDQQKEAPSPKNEAGGASSEPQNGQSPEPPISGKLPKREDNKPQI